MRDFQVSEIKRHPDRAIDTSHYMRIARQRRSQQAREMADAVSRGCGLLRLRVRLRTAFLRG